MANLELHNPPRVRNRWTAPGSYVSVQSRLSTGEVVRVQRASVGSTRKERETKSLRQPQRPTSLRTAGRPKSASSEPETNLHPRDDQTNTRSLPPVYAKERSLPPLRKPDPRDSEQYERGRSAPPTSNSFTSAFWPVVSLQHTKSLPHKPPERPLPPLPSSAGHFRLGGKDLPWSVPTPDFYFTPAPEASPRSTSTTPTASSSPEPSTRATGMSKSKNLSTPSTAAKSKSKSKPKPKPNRSLDDPQRVQDLAALSTAMMTVDTLLPDSGWSPSTFTSASESTRSVGWAVSSESSPVSPRPLPPAPERESSRERRQEGGAEEAEGGPRKREPWQDIKLPEEEDEDKPPPYCVSQWEARWNVEPAEVRSGMGAGMGSSKSTC